MGKVIQFRVKQVIRHDIEGWIKRIGGENDIKEGLKILHGAGKKKIAKLELKK